MCVTPSPSHQTVCDTHSLLPLFRPRTLPIPGFDLENVLLLRDPSQANKIAELATGKNVVVIGTSFIGMDAHCHYVQMSAF